MDDLRIVIAVFISCVCFYLTYDLLFNGFFWPLLIAIVMGFTVVHLLWPRHSDKNSGCYDFLELIYDLPYRCIALTLRGLGKTLKNPSTKFELR